MNKYLGLGLVNKYSVALIVILFAIAVSYKLFFSDNINSKFFNDSGKLDGEIVEDIKVDLRLQQKNKLLVTSPGMYEYLNKQLLNIGVQGSDEEVSDISYAISISDFNLDLDLGLYGNDFYPKLNEQYSSNNYNEFSLTWINHSRTVESLTELEERIVGNAILHLVVRGVKSELISIDKISKQYSLEKNKKSRFRYLEFSLLQSLWLLNHKDTLINYSDFDNSYTSNILVSDFLKIKENFKTSGDLIRLLNNNDPNIVISSAKLIKNIIPDNALHALRYHLIRSKSDRVKLVLLDAFSVYGNKARAYDSQLKQLMRLTDSDDVKKKIQLVLQKINGRS